MNSPIWIDPEAFRLLHSESLAEYGGLSGMRDVGLLMSALARLCFANRIPYLLTQLKISANQVIESSPTVIFTVLVKNKDT